MLTDGLWIIVMFLSDSHSDGTHSLQSIHYWDTFLQTWWRNKLIFILDGLRVRTFLAYFTFCMNGFFKVKPLTLCIKVRISSASLGFFAQGGSSCFRTKAERLIPREVDLWSVELQRSTLFCPFTSKALNLTSLQRNDFTVTAFQPPTIVNNTKVLFS